MKDEEVWLRLLEALLRRQAGVPESTFSAVRKADELFDEFKIRFRETETKEDNPK